MYSLATIQFVAEKRTDDSIMRGNTIG